MMRRIEASTKYKKSRKRCQRRGLNLKLLDEVEDILATRPFTESEIVKYKVHNLSGNWKGYTELHLGNKSSNWILVYKISGGNIRFEDTYVLLDNTGTHDECLGNEMLYSELVWL